MREGLLRRNTKDLKVLRNRFDENLEYFQGYDPIIANEVEMLIEQSYHLSEKLSDLDESKIEPFISLLRLSTKLDARLTDSIDRLNYKIGKSTSFALYLRLRKENQIRSSSTERMLDMQKEVYGRFEEIKDGMSN